MGRMKDHYACLFLDEKRGMRNLKMRNFSRGKQMRKTRKCEIKNQAFLEAFGGGNDRKFKIIFSYSAKSTLKWF